MPSHTQILAATVLFLSIGCRNQTRPARQFDITLAPHSPAVVLVEFVEQTSHGDCPRFHPEKILSAALIPSDSHGHFIIHKPRAHSDFNFLGLYAREQFARWTIFQPGYIITTVYPEGRDIWNAGNPTAPGITPRLGWCAPSVDNTRHETMRPNQPLAPPFNNDDRAIQLTLHLRPLPPESMRIQPDPRWQDGPVIPPQDAFCVADRETCLWQLEHLLSLGRSPAGHISAASHELLSHTIDLQKQSLQNAFSIIQCNFPLTSLPTTQTTSPPAFHSTARPLSQ